MSKQTRRDKQRGRVRKSRGLRTLTILSEVPAREMVVPLSPTSEGSVWDIQLVTMAMVLSTAPIFRSGTLMSSPGRPPGPSAPPHSLAPGSRCSAQERTRTWCVLLLLLPLPPAKGQSAARAQESLKTSSHVPAARIRRHHSDAQHTLFFSQRVTASAWLALLCSLSLPSSLSLLSRSFKMPRCALAASLSLFLSLPLPSPPLPLSSLVPHPSLCLLPLFWLLCASWSLSFVSTKNQRGRGDAHPQIFVQQSAVWSRRYLKGLSSLTTAQRRLTARAKLGFLSASVLFVCAWRRRAVLLECLMRKRMRHSSRRLSPDSSSITCASDTPLIKE